MLDSNGFPVPLHKEFALYRQLRDFDFFRQVLFRILDAWNGGREAEAVHWLQAALDEIQNQDRQQLSVANSSMISNIQILCRQIQQQPEKRWLLTELAAEYGYSPDYFGRLFSAIVGSPLSEYILTVRINQAKLLLRDSDSNIHEISDQLGYKDSGFFCRQFKKKTGISPAAYRKTLQTARNNLIPKRKPRLEK